MKFYNPFKPHVIHTNGKFFVRRWKVILGWVYLDSESQNWWMDCYACCQFETEQEARDRIERNKVVVLG